MYLCIVNSGSDPVSAVYNCKQSCVFHVYIYTYTHINPNKRITLNMFRYPYTIQYVSMCTYGFRINIHIT